MTARLLSVCLLAVLVTACDRATGPDTSPLLLHPMSVGEVHLPGRPAGQIVIPGGAQGGEYVLVTLNASGTAGSNLALEVSGTGLSAPAAAAVAAASLQPADAAVTRAVLLERGRAALERTIWQRQRAQLEPRLADAQHEALRRIDAGVAGEFLALALGDTVTFNARPSCEMADRDLRGGRVAAVSQHAVVVVDTTAPPPPQGFTDSDFERFARQYDELVHPLIAENFGAMARFPGNQRVVLFFTTAVNRMGTPAGFVAGYFWPGDLFPRQGEAGRLAPCPAGNEREIVYLLVPDPNGRFGERHFRENVELTTLSTIAHELQHVVNTARRMYEEPRTGFEEVWLNEALSHVAEELLMYRTSSLEPRRRIDANALRDNPVDFDAFRRHQRPNIRRFRTRLVIPDTALISPNAPLQSRGAGWSFLRYIADHRGGIEAQLWRSLIDTDRAGMENLRKALGVDPMDRLLDWSVAVYADGVVAGLDPRWRHPSWNLRSVASMDEVDANRNYPLTLTALSQQSTLRSLGAGGNAYLRFRVDPGASATVNITSGGRPPPATLRYALVRVQ
jgi:hypothetical protein